MSFLLLPRRGQTPALVVVRDSAGEIRQLHEDDGLGLLADLLFEFDVTTAVRPALAGKPGGDGFAFHSLGAA